MIVSFSHEYCKNSYQSNMGRTTVLLLCVSVSPVWALAAVVCGLSVPHARPTTPSTRALSEVNWPEQFPYSTSDLTPEWDGKDQSFYLIPKFGHHAGEECRESLTKFYAALLPPEDGQVLDLCSSFTSHYPKGWQGKRCVAIGLNALELLANPSKTEFKVQNLNADPNLPFEDESFDVITNSLSVDYMTKPLELFAEMHRVLKPGGYAAMAFTNRCFPTVCAILRSAKTR